MNRQPVIGVSDSARLWGRFVLKVTEELLKETDPVKKAFLRGKIAAYKHVVATMEGLEEKL